MPSPTSSTQAGNPVPISQAFALAAEHFHAGRYDQTETIANLILQADPLFAQGHHLLGVVAYRRGEHDRADRLITRAIELNPAVPEFYSNRALALGQLGRVAEAEAGYRRALAMAPTFVDAMLNYSRLLCDSGRAAEGLEVATAAVSMRPNSAPAHNQVGIALMGCGRYRDAEAAYRRALSLQGDFLHALNNLGNSLDQQGRLGEAVAVFNRAIDLDPNAFETRVSLANALRDMDRIDDAIASFQIALSLRPGLPDILACLGSSYREQGRIDLAVEHLQLAVAGRPQSADLRSNLLYFMQYHPEFDSAAQWAEHRAYGDLVVAAAPRNIAPFNNSPDPDRPLRIGLVSADFRTHPVGRQILPLFRLRDRAAFQFICYSAVFRPDKTTDLFRTLADGWRHLPGIGDENAARIIRSDAIDILIDLSLHTAGRRAEIFAHKPAPVSATFAGYPGSTGIARADWRISDPHLDPPGQSESDYVERTARMPRSFWCFDPDHDAPDVNPLPALTNGYLTFGCLGHPCKLNPTVIKLWAAVLNRVQTSRLRLLAAPGVAHHFIAAQFAAAGVDPNRIDFVQRQPRADYLREFARIDIGLDTIPYNGHTTTLDCFWMGVPVVSHVGRTVVGRAGLSQLTNLGLGELVATSPDDFLQIATRVASDLPALNDMRQTLRARMAQSPLCDLQQFSSDFQLLMRQLWKDWCAAQTV
jgi:predicted O-linked N-acetylglucosamine transferase (SPINDLY family)